MGGSASNNPAATSAGQIKSSDYSDFGKSIAGAFGKIGSATANQSYSVPSVDYSGAFRPISMNFGQQSSVLQPYFSKPNFNSVRSPYSNRAT